MVNTENDAPLLLAAIAERLAPGQAVQVRAAGMRTQLFDRVRSSVMAHSEFLTVRREDGAWQEGPDGLRARTLRCDSVSRVELVRMRPGTVLAWPPGVTAQEILVLEGALAAADAAIPMAPAGVAHPGSGYAYQVRHHTATGPALLAQGDTTVYLRHLLVDIDTLPALEAHWWRIPGPASGWVHPGRKRWVVSAPGVEVLPLKGDSDVVSMLVRFAPGASVADHHHALDEDCLVLDGEMFLGDILLRAGDYQLAPAGGGHFGEISDVGVVFFFHGAIDPVLRVKS
jgi:quercetin dioxygenase-like cupin family protein